MHATLSKSSANLSMPVSAAASSSSAATWRAARRSLRRDSRGRGRRRDCSSTRDRSWISPRPRLRRSWGDSATTWGGVRSAAASRSGSRGLSGTRRRRVRDPVGKFEFDDNHYWLLTEWLIIGIRGVMTPTPESESESDFRHFSDIFDSDSSKNQFSYCTGIDSKIGYLWFRFQQKTD